MPALPQSAGERDIWLDRYAAYPIALGADPAEVSKTRAAVAASLHGLRLEQDETILRDGGFLQADLLYAALAWRGWIAEA